MRQDRLFFRLFAFTLLLLSGVAFGVAGSADASRASGLVGHWTCSERLPDGRELVTDTTLTADSRFAGNAYIAGQRVWTYAGSWRLDGNLLVWNYDQSSRPMPESMKTDTDEIVALNPGALILLSRRSGEQHTFLRRD